MLNNVEQNENIFVVWQSDDDVQVKRELMQKSFDATIEVGRLVFETTLNTLARVVDCDGDNLLVAVGDRHYDSCKKFCLAAKINQDGLRSRLSVIQGGRND